MTFPGFVKNNFALASTVAMLAWGMLAFPGGYSKAGQTQHGMDTIRWGTDYMLASYLGSTANDTSYVGQVLLTQICQFLTLDGHAP